MAELTEKHLNIAFRMLSARKTCKQFYKDQWPSKLNEWLPIVKACMVNNNCHELDAAIIILKQLDESDISGKHISMLIILATALELIEPDQGVKHG